MERGLNVLLELWPHLLEQLPDSTLVIASYNDFPSDKKEEIVLKELIDHYPDSITHLGKLNAERLYEEMSTSEYWLYPTSWPETSCITALEMLANGVICLYYPVAGLVDTMKNYGVPVEKGNELSTLLNLTVDQKKELRENGVNYALSCSWENRAKAWADVLLLNNILFVTAFKYINRDKWTSFCRTTNTYIDYFLMLANNIKYNLIVYIEDDVIDILKTYSLKDNIIIKRWSEVNTFFNKYIDMDKLVMESDMFKNKIPLDKREYPQHKYSEYNLINHSKINFISHTKNIYPSYEFYSWIDFGYVRNIKSVPRNIRTYNLPKKLIYHCIKTPTNRIDSDSMIKTDDIYLTGSSYIIHNSIINEIEELYNNKIKQWYSEYITHNDQTLILQLYYDNPDLFFILQNDNWFTLYNMLSL